MHVTCSVTIQIMYFLKCIFLFTCCLLCKVPVFAQSEVCDSLLNLPVSQPQIDLLLEQTIYKKYAQRALE